MIVYIDLPDSLAMMWAQVLVARLAVLSLEEKTASKLSLAQEMEAKQME